MPYVYELAKRNGRSRDRPRNNNVSHVDLCLVVVRRVADIRASGKACRNYPTCPHPSDEELWALGGSATCRFFLKREKKPGLLPHTQVHGGTLHTQSKQLCKIILNLAKKNCKRLPNSRKRLLGQKCLSLSLSKLQKLIKMQIPCIHRSANKLYPVECNCFCKIAF